MEQTALNYARIEKAIEYLDRHFREQPALEEVARAVHLSPYHFQRLFSEWAGVSPKKFLQYLTLDFLRERIRAGESIAAAADAAGLSAQSRVYDLFVTMEGVTPQTFRTAGEGLTIRYGYHFTPFGRCFLAIADRGICGLAFIEAGTEAAELEAFRQKWPFARLVREEAVTSQTVHQIFGNPAEHRPLRLLVQGSPFQLRVWDALLHIPPGAVSTYEQIARSIGQPGAQRAVGTAIGSNPVAYLIPCHRVIRKTGHWGGYRWGSSRKPAMIGWEMVREGMNH